MENKLLIAVAALGVLLLVLLSLPQEKMQTLADVSDVVEEQDAGLIESGRFVLEQSGVPIIEEGYELLRMPDGTHMLVSEASVASPGGTTRLAQQYVLEHDYSPSLYQLAVQGPSGAQTDSQIVSAQAGLSGLEMVHVGSAAPPTAVSDLGNTVILDNLLVSHYALLLRVTGAKAIEPTFTAAVPQQLIALPSRLQGPDAVEVTYGGRTLSGERHVLHLGDLRVVLVAVDGQLAAVAIPTQRVLAYDAARYPNRLALGDELVAPLQSPTGLTEQEIAFASGELTLTGTLTLPRDAADAVPGALFVHGSGPIDRDGNAVNPETGEVALAMDAYRQLALALAEAGIASLRYDKRGVGGSEGDSAASSPGDLEADVRAGLAALRSVPGVDPARCFLIGHSEGGYLSPRVAAEDPQVAGLILLAAAARPLGEITRWQVETLNRAAGLTEEQLDAVLVQQDQYTAFVQGSQGEWEDYTFEALQTAMPWLTEEALANLKATPLSLSWLRGHYNDDPASTLGRVTCPVLILNGEKDAQVPFSEGERIRAALVEAGNEEVTLAVLSDLNHLLREHPEAPSLLFRHVADPVDPRVTSAVTEWIASHSAP